MRENRVADQRVELGGRNAAVEILRDLVDDGHQAAEAALRLCRQKRDRSKRRKRNELVDDVREFPLTEFSLLLAREIPLVSDDDQAFALFDGQTGEAPVLR